MQDSVPGSWLSRFVWSKDSRQLAIALESPLGSDKYKITLDTFDIAKKARRASIQVSDSSDGLSLPTGMCFLEWSPDGRYVSFVEDCDYSQFNYKDVYIAEVASGTVAQLTDTKTKLGIPRNDIAGSFLEPLWYDTHTLLVGEAIWRGMGAVTHLTETVAYKLPEGNVVIAGYESATHWAKNPVSEEIAYLAQAFSSDTSSINGSFDVKTIQIDTFDGQTLIPKISVSAPLGYLSWSPDGLFLAHNVNGSAEVVYYTEQGSGSFYLSETTFIDKSSGRTTRYSPPANRHIETRIIGWLLVPPK
jgi:hypothetical protein